VVAWRALKKSGTVPRPGGQIHPPQPVYSDQVDRFIHPNPCTPTPWMDLSTANLGGTVLLLAHEKVSNLGHPRRCANSNPPTTAVTAAALPLWEPRTSSRMPCAQQAHSYCRSPPAALGVSHCTTTLQPFART
jgi:hypothetical protein